MKFMNVGEHWCLYDTILIGGSSISTPGWYTTLANCSRANRLYFFNQRTRADGLAYCNQDTRDQTPFAFRVYSAGISFFAPTITMTDNAGDPEDMIQKNDIASIWCADLPRHCSFTLQVQQDELLKSCAMLVPPGYGPVGGGVAQNSLRGVPGASNYYVDSQLFVSSQSTAHLSNRWDFPQPLEIPRNAALSANIVLAEWAKQLLQTAGAQMDEIVQAQYGINIGATTPFAGIQVTLTGERLVQQRGAYHR